MKYTQAKLLVALLAAGPLIAQAFPNAAQRAKEDRQRPPLGTGIAHIGDIQATPLSSEEDTYTVEAIVTGVYGNRKPAGFYVQETAEASDGNPATSDALFIAQNNPVVRVGDRVRVEGKIEKNTLAPSFEQATMSRAEVKVVSSGNSLPQFSMLVKPLFSVAELKQYAGMQVELAMPLTVSEVYNLKWKGELLLSAGGKLFQPTQFIDPNDSPDTGTTSMGNSNAAAVTAFQEANSLRSILLDAQGTNSPPSAPPFLDPVLRTMRIGSTVQHLRGVLSYEEGKWHLHALSGANAPVFKVERPVMPTFGKVDVKLASFNVLNYFNGDGLGGGFPTERGARTAVDFARQRSKIIATLVRIDADIIGLTEIENDRNGPNSALQDLVNGLNEAVGAGTYAFINDGGTTKQPNNTDVLHSAIVYKVAAAVPASPAMLDLTPGIFERPPLAQLFTIKRQGHAETLAVVVNHFKSKGSGTGENADQNDGQGGSNPRRRDQAHELVKFIRSRVLPAGATRVVSIGDYNANYEEDPIDIMRAAGLVVATPPTSASYVFKGFTGSLDHCIITPNLVGFIDVQKWNINSYEPTFLEYTQAGDKTDIGSPFRSSDHDPVLIGVRFLGIANAGISAEGSRLLTYPCPETGITIFKLDRFLPANTEQLNLEFRLLQGVPLVQMKGSPRVLQAELGRYTAHLAPGIYQLRLKGKGFDVAQQVMKE